MRKNHYYYKGIELFKNQRHNLSNGHRIMSDPIEFLVLMFFNVVSMSLTEKDL